MIHVDEISIDETRRFVEQVVVRLKIEDVSFLELVINLDFIFDDEGHIAEW